MLFEVDCYAKTTKSKAYSYCALVQANVKTNTRYLNKICRWHALVNLNITDLSVLVSTEWYNLIRKQELSNVCIAFVVCFKQKGKCDHEASRKRLVDNIDYVYANKRAEMFVCCAVEDNASILAFLFHHTLLTYVYGVDFARNISHFKSHKQTQSQWNRIRFSTNDEWRPACKRHRVFQVVCTCVRISVCKSFRESIACKLQAKFF